MNRELKIFILFISSSYIASLVTLNFFSKDIILESTTKKAVLLKNIRDNESQFSSPQALGLETIQSDFQPETSVIVDYKLQRDQILFKFGYSFFKFFNKIFSRQSNSSRSIFIDVPPVYVASKSSTNFFIFDPHAAGPYFPAADLKPNQIKSTINQAIEFLSPYDTYSNADFFFPRISFGTYSPANGFSVIEKSALRAERKIQRWEYFNAGLIGVNFLRDWDFLTTTISHSGRIDLSIDYYYDDSCVTQFQNAIIFRDLKPAKDQTHYFTRYQVLKNKIPSCHLREITIKVFSLEPQDVKVSHNGFVRLKSSR